ncbi:MAG: hypothetical protein CL933_08875 [Deltaproteobacteria bacterium]|nr:hypothetical protein [Deltaproteobacteria bacterium]
MRCGRGSRGCGCPCGQHGGRVLPKVAPPWLRLLAAGEHFDHRIRQAVAIGWGGWGIVAPIGLRGSFLKRGATTVAGLLAFQGRALRVHFDWNAPPVCAVATVVGHTLPISANPDCAP